MNPTDQPTPQAPALPAEVREAVSRELMSVGKRGPIGTKRRGFLVEQVCAALAPLWPTLPPSSPQAALGVREGIRNTLLVARDRLEHYRQRSPDDISADIKALNDIDGAVVALAPLLAAPVPAGGEHWTDPTYWEDAMKAHPSESGHKQIAVEIVNAIRSKFAPPDLSAEVARLKNEVWVYERNLKHEQERARDAHLFFIAVRKALNIESVGSLSTLRNEVLAHLRALLSGKEGV